MQNIFPVNNLYEYQYGLFNLDNHNVFFNDKTNTNNPFLISVVKDNHWLNIKPLSENIITYDYIDNIIKYSNVFDNVNIECYVEDNRIIEKYYNNSKQTSFEYTLKLSDTIKYEINNGRITFKDKVTNDILWIISSEKGYYSIKYQNDNLVLKLTLLEMLDTFSNSIELNKILPEIIEHRTEYAKVYDTGKTDDKGNRLLEQHIYLKPIHRKVNDKYEEIDLNIKQTDKFEFEWINDTNKFISYFGDRTKANNHLTSFEIINSDGISRWINFKLLNGDSAITSVDGSRIRFENILEDIDLEYLITDNEQKENIYLNSPNASKIITFTLKLDGVYLEKLDDIIRFKDIDTDEILWFIDKPFMYDSSDIPNRSDNVEYVLGKTTIDTVQYDTLTVYANDDEFFSNAIYPIVIDPTVTLQPDGTAGIDTYINSGLSTNNFGNSTYLEIGRTNSNNRVLIKFDTSSLPNSPIVSATLNLYMFGSANANTYRIDLHNNISAFDETSATWNNSNAIYDSNINSYTNVSNTIGWYGWDVTSLVSSFINSTLTNNGFTLKYNSESGTNIYKDFRSSEYSTDASLRPKLVVTYPEPPASPLNLNATVQSSSRILWSWTDNSSDETGFKLRDSSNILITVNLYLSDGTTPISNGLIPAGTTSIIERGLLPNTSYTRRIYAYNTNGDSTLDITGEKSATTNSIPTFNTFAGTKNGLNNLTWIINKT